MMVLVDTSVWSLALRRHAKDLSLGQKQIRDELAELIREGRAQLLGPVRQELLSGIRSEPQYEQLRSELRAFDSPALAVEDYEEAARANNHCRRRGVNGSVIDFLICAVAMRRDWQIFTMDIDFSSYAKHVPIRLHTVREEA